jgi:hypothetical protein
MSNLHGRLDRLEKQTPDNEGECSAFEKLLADIGTLSDWLDERGYSDCLAALEAGESGPQGLETMLKEQASHCHMDRAFARVEKAIKPGVKLTEAEQRQLEADVALVTGRNRGKS